MSTMSTISMTKVFAHSPKKMPRKFVLYVLLTKLGYSMKYMTSFKIRYKNTNTKDVIEAIILTFILVGTPERRSGK